VRPTFDTSALTAPFGPEEVRSLALAARDDRPTPRGALGRALGIGLLALVFTAMLLSMVHEWRQRGPWPAAFVLLVLGGLAAFIVAVTIANAGAAQRRRERHVRLARFASENGLRWMPAGNAPHYPGTIFYCPEGYERDALYVFTPDLMALLIDEVGAYDVEIVDDRMTLFTRRPIDLLDPETWCRYERIMELVLPKARRQTRRYRDERAEDGEIIAVEGRRLRTGVPWSAIAIGVGVFGGWIVLRFLLGG